MIGGNFWAPAGTNNMVNSPVMTSGTTSPSVFGQTTSPNAQNPTGQVPGVSSRSPKRTHSEIDGDDNDPVEVKRQKCDEATASDASLVALPLRVKPQLKLEIPASDSTTTTVGGVMPQPAACKRKRQDTASPDGLATLMKKLKCNSPEPVAAKPKKAKSSWDSFEVKEFDNKSGKLNGSWDFDQLSYNALKPRNLVICECDQCSFTRWIANYSS